MHGTNKDTFVTSVTSFASNHPLIWVVIGVVTWPLAIVILPIYGMFYLATEGRNGILEIAMAFAVIMTGLAGARLLNPQDQI